MEKKVVVAPDFTTPLTAEYAEQVCKMSSEETESESESTYDKIDEDDFDRLLDEFIASEKNNMADTEENSDTSDNQDNGHDTAPIETEVRVPAETRLENMIGLSGLKKDMEEARIMALFTKQRKALELDTTSDNRHHMLFLGNPGTGKTTVAKLVGEMYRDMGLLSIGHTIELNRSKLIGEFIGHTEKNTVEAIEQARGGVLFIDEAYTLTDNGKDSNDFGKEVINTLLTVLSEPDPDMIVILAGYEDKMQELLATNPGLKERFPLKFHFEDYTKEELLEIAHYICHSRNFRLTPAADQRLYGLIEKTLLCKDEHFGNGRWVHNLIEHGIIKYMAKRVMAAPHIPDDRELFCLIEESDVIEAEQKFLQDKDIKIVSHPRIGFTA
ncbi:MAG: AAA family ATPase [Prevotellaceae bacterium]|nr:AAA family ATPase [Prevotellaceae bacterium]